MGVRGRDTGHGCGADSWKGNVIQGMNQEHEVRLRGHKFPLMICHFDSGRGVGGSITYIFKQKTAYEIKRCDWSSDVCSSDLILNPPPSSLPVPSLWVVPVHQPQAPNIVHQTWTGDSFHIWYYTCFNAILPNHPTLSLSHRVQKTVLYISVSFAVSYTVLLLPSF